MSSGGARTITLTVHGVWDAGSTGGAKGMLRELHAEQEKLAKQTATTVKRESKSVEKELEADRKKSLALTQSTDRAIERSAKAMADVKARVAKRAANDFLASLKREEQAAAASSKKIESYFSQAFKGGFVGGLVGTLTAQLASIPGRILGGLETSFEKAMKFRQMELSLAQFSGSADAAKAKIQELIRVSAETPGLSFVSAVDGQKRLQAIGFEADVATKILTGMSKIRVLSGSTKEDFDAMLVNLVQIASGGQKVTQEIREMATRMPYLVGLIKQEFGGIGKELNEIDPKVFVERLANAAATTEVSFASSSLAVENLQDAFDRLYIAVGSVIEQNPEVIALLQTLTKEVSGNSEELMKNESQTRSTFSTWVSMTARAGIAVTNFVDEAQADVKALVAFLAAAALGYGAYMMRLLGAFPMAINETIIKPVNVAIGLLKNLPSFMGGIPGLVGEIPLIPTGEGLANQMGRAAQLSWMDVSNQAAKDRSAKRWQDYEANLEALRNKPTSTGTPKTASTIGGPGKTANAGGGSGRPTVAKGGEQQMRRFFDEELGFDVNRTYGRAINPGSMHTSGRAIDVNHRGIPTEELVRRIALAIEKGYQFVDERVKRKGIKQTGPHLHFEKDPNDPSSFLDASYYGGERNLAYLKAIDAKRLGKGGGTSGGLAQDVGRTMSEQSDALTKEQRNKFIRQALMFYKAAGLIPDKSLLDEFHKLMVEEARQAGVVQPDGGDTLRSFTANAAAKAGIISTTGPSNLPGLTRAKNEDESFVAARRDGLNLEQRLTQYVLRRRNIESEIADLVKDQGLTRDDDILNLTVQIELLKRINVGEEAKRRGLSDELNVRREIVDIQTQILNIGRNDALDRERDRLNDILTIEKSRLELNRALELSQERVVAGVYQHLAGQKTLNQGLVDGINGTYDALLKRMNSPLDKLNNKSGGLLSIITEPLKAMQGQRLSSLFTGVLDKIFPGMGSQLEKSKNPVVGELKDHTKLLEQIARNTGGLPMGYNPTAGGGIGSILGNFGIGGGSGMGPGGTPWFNPTAGGTNPFFAAGQSAGATAIGAANGGSGGGIWDMIRGGFKGGFGKMFGPRKNILTGKMSGLAGTLGGIGDIANMAGGMIGGRWGNLISMAGMGASIGANFGPWGAAIGAGIGGAAGLIMALLGGDNAIKKIKEAALSQYGITVKDKSVLRSLKQLGEQYFGKGKVGENAVQLVQTDEAKAILRNYAEATNQSGLKIDKLSYGDENWAGNNFSNRFGGFRAMGGPVNAGMAYIVGERRPELFVPHTNGTIMPAVPNVTTTDANIAPTLEALSDSLTMLAAELGRIKSISAGRMLQMGVKENPEAVREGYERTLQADPVSTRSLNELTGNVI